MGQANRSGEPSKLDCGGASWRLASAADLASVCSLIPSAYLQHCLTPGLGVPLCVLWPPAILSENLFSSIFRVKIPYPDTVTPVRLPRCQTAIFPLLRHK